MNKDGPSSSNPQPPPASGGDGSGKKVRKPYTISKSRESWTDEEHDKFLEALQLFDRDWKKIEDFVGSKTVIQIRSHAQKYFLKVQKNGTSAHVPPPRPKRKAAHLYPQKATKSVLAPLLVSVNPLAPRYPPWDDASLLVSQPLSEAMPSRKDFNATEDDVRLSETMGVSNCKMSGFVGLHNTPRSSELTKKGKGGSVLHGIPDFAEVYDVMGSVFDPQSINHVVKLKEMDPIIFETVLLLMRNLTVNLSNPDFEPIKQVLSSYDVGAKHVGIIGAE